MGSQPSSLQKNLHYAARMGRVDDVIKAMDEGARMDEKDDNGWTPFHEACANGHEDVVNVGMKACGMRVVQQVNGEGASCLMLAIMAQSPSLVALLMPLSDVSGRQFEGLSVLHVAALMRDAETILMLRKQGALVNVVDHLDRTPLDLCETVETKDAMVQVIDKEEDLDSCQSESERD